MPLPQLQPEQLPAQDRNRSCVPPPPRPESRSRATRSRWSSSHNETELPARVTRGDDQRSPAKSCSLFEGVTTHDSRRHQCGKPGRDPGRITTWLAALTSPRVACSNAIEKRAAFCQRPLVVSWRDSSRQRSLVLRTQTEPALMRSSRAARTARFQRC